MLGGRLFDARFFFGRPTGVKELLEHAQGLSGIGFQRDLGTMADKVARGVGGDGAAARRTGWGCLKPDVTPCHAPRPFFAPT